MATQLSPKDPTENLRIVFDFTMWLGEGEDIRTDSGSAPFVTSAVASGADPSPGDMISGQAAVDGAKVVQMISGGRLGTTYRLGCTVNTDHGQRLTLSALLPIDYVYGGGC